MTPNIAVAQNASSKDGYTEEERTILTQLDSIENRIDILSKSLGTSDDNNYIVSPEVEENLDDILSNVTIKSLTAKEITIVITSFNIELTLIKLNIKITLYNDDKVMLNYLNGTPHRFFMKSDLHLRYKDKLIEMRTKMVNDTLNNFKEILKSIEDE